MHKGNLQTQLNDTMVLRGRLENMTTWKKSPGLRLSLLKLFTPRPVNRGNSDDTLFVVP